MLLESTPVIADCIPVMSTGAWTTIDSYAFVQVSWRIHRLLSFEFVAYRLKASTGLAHKIEDFSSEYQIRAEQKVEFFYT